MRALKPSAPRGVVCEDRLSGSKGGFSRPIQHPARCLEDDRTRGAGYDIRLVDCGGRIYVNRLQDAKTEMAAYTLDGKLTGRSTWREWVNFGRHGQTADRFGFFSFESFLAPPTIYRLDTATGKREVFFQQRSPSIPASMS